jgi:hypothetical protein
MCDGTKREWTVKRVNKVYTYDLGKGKEKRPMLEGPGSTLIAAHTQEVPMTQ